MKRHFCIDATTILVPHQAVPPKFYNKIAPMHMSNALVANLDQWKDGNIY